MTDAGSSSGSAEQAENAINVHCLFFKMSLKQIYCGEKGSECGEREPWAWGAPESPGVFFSIWNLKKKKDPQKNPTHKYSEAVGMFYWDLAKGKKRKMPFRGEAGPRPYVF